MGNDMVEKIANIGIDTGKGCFTIGYDTAKEIYTLVLNHLASQGDRLSEDEEAIKNVIAEYGYEHKVAYDSQYYIHNMPEFLRVAREAENKQIAKYEAKLQKVIEAVEDNELTTVVHQYKDNPAYLQGAEDKLQSILKMLGGEE